MPSNVTTGLLLSAAAATTAVVGSQVFDQISPSSPGFSVRAESCLLTKPDLPGNGWLEPWEPDPNAPVGDLPKPTQEQWKQQGNVLAMLDKFVAMVATMPEEDFKNFMALLSGNPAALDSGGGAGNRSNVPTLDVFGGGPTELQKQVQEKLQKGTLTKADFLQLFREYRINILDAASIEFERSSSPTRFPFDRIRVDLFVFSDYATQQMGTVSDAFRAGTGAEAKMQELMVAFEKRFKDNDAAEIQRLQTQKNELMSEPDRTPATQQRIAEIDRTVASISSRQVAVKADIVANSSAGIRLVTRSTKDGMEDIIVVAQVKVGNAVFSFVRSASGPYAANALTESDDLIQLLITRLDPYDR